jgi:hypothetical protein
MAANSRRFIFQLLRAIGVLLVITSATYAVYLLAARPFIRPAPLVLRVGSGFEGSAQLPKAEIDSLMADGEHKVAGRNTAGNRFSVLAAAGEWLAFALSSLITLVAGYHGVNVTGDTAATTAELVKARSVRFTRIVGAIAAAAAVSTALTGRATVAADGYYKSADDLQRKLTSARKDILEAKTAADARDIIDRVKADLARR